MNAVAELSTQDRNLLLSWAHVSDRELRRCLKERETPEVLQVRRRVAALRGLPTGAAR